MHILSKMLELLCWNCNFIYKLKYLKTIVYWRHAIASLLAEWSFQNTLVLTLWENLSIDHNHLITRSTYGPYQTLRCRTQSHKNVMSQHITWQVLVGANRQWQAYKPFKDRKPTIVALTLSSHNFPTDRVRELFKASTDSESLLV